MGKLSARRQTIYRITSWRTTRHGPEKVTMLRRQATAARRLALDLEALGRGPVNIEVAKVQWQAVSWR